MGNDSMDDKPGKKKSFKHLNHWMVITIGIL